MKIAKLKLEIPPKSAAAKRKLRKRRAWKKSETLRLAALKGLRDVRCGPRTDGPMRFEEQLHSIVLQPGKIRISCRRIQRWLEFKH
jgi:hypothetical protein